jgi:PIN domain nuclease of toxin-antitoxin system
MVGNAAEEDGVELPITDEIMAEAYCLPPPIHRDPADLVMIATARLERLTVVTTDGKILSYPMWPARHKNRRRPVA